MSPAPFAETPQGGPRFLVIRRDNIGDLVCTTPLLSALRERYPHGYIAALVNTYNEAVLAGNPALDAVYAYEKGKHRGEARSIVSVYSERVGLLWSLRRKAFDYAIVAASAFEPRSLRLARIIGARRVLGYAEPDKVHARPDIALTYDRSASTHEVERVFALLAPLGINGPPAPTRVFPDAAERRDVERAIPWPERAAALVGVHISARRANQQWPAENFAALIRSIATRHQVRFLLLWSPGDADNPKHPGDDRKARAVLEGCDAAQVLPLPTPSLSRLIAALSWCDYVICPDGGAMHLAAALGKPILCFFGDSPPERWRPWRTPHELLQPSTRNLRNLSVEEAREGFERLLRAVPPAQPLR